VCDLKNLKNEEATTHGSQRHRKKKSFLPLIILEVQEIFDPSTYIGTFIPYYTCPHHLY